MAVVRRHRLNALALLDLRVRRLESRAQGGIAGSAPDVEKRLQVADRLRAILGAERLPVKRRRGRELEEEHCRAGHRAVDESGLAMPDGVGKLPEARSRDFRKPGHDLARRNRSHFGAVIVSARHIAVVLQETKHDSTEKSMETIFAPLRAKS